MKGLVEEVSEASRQQAQGIDQVTQAIAQMEKVTQTTAATAEESAAASEELNAQAEGVDGRRPRARGDGRRAAPAPGRPTSRDADGPAAGDGQPARGHAAEAPARPPRPTAEEQIPFGDTGTFGKF